MSLFRSTVVPGALFAAFRRSKMEHKSNKRKKSGGTSYNKKKVKFDPIRRLGGSNRSNASEIKTVDIPITNNVCSTTAVFTLVPLVQTGTEFYNRVGRRIQMKSLRIRAHILPNWGNSASMVDNENDVIRYMVVYDKQSNAATPGIADVLSDVDGTGAVTTNSLSGLNMNNAERFIVLRDKVLNMGALGANAQSEDADMVGMQSRDPTTPLLINEFIKLKGLECHFQSTHNPITSADISTGALYIIVYSAIPVAASQWLCTQVLRLRFKDL